MTPGCIEIKKKQANGSRVIIWAKFCWKTLDPAIHMEGTYLCILKTVSVSVSEFIEPLPLAKVKGYSINILALGLRRNH